MSTFLATNNSESHQEYIEHQQHSIAARKTRDFFTKTASIFGQDRKRAFSLESIVGSQRASDLHYWYLVDLQFQVFQHGVERTIAELGMQKKFDQLLSMLQLILRQAAIMYDNEKKAGIEPLTQLLNRKQFEDKRDEIERNAEKKYKNRDIGVVFLDLDDFKQVNDTYGHHVGDTLLKLFAERLSSAVDKQFLQAFLYRYGGEEFTLFIFPQHPETFLLRLQTIVDELTSAPYTLSKMSEGKEETEEYFLNLSVGVRLLRRGEKNRNIDQAVRAADQATYTSKETKHTEGRGGKRYMITVHD